MRERMQEWLEKLRKGGKNQWVIFLLAGLLLLVIAIPTGNTPKEEPVEVEAPQVVAEGDKAEALEEKLERVLREVRGVGQAKVLITLKSDGKKLVEKDNNTSSRASSDIGTDQGTSTVQENSMEEATIFERDDSGREVPYVTETVEPEVSGVLVVAEGGDNPVVVSDITEAVQALFGIEVHKIKVMKMN